MPVVDIATGHWALVLIEEKYTLEGFISLYTGGLVPPWKAKSAIMKEKRQRHGASHDLRQLLSIGVDLGLQVGDSRTK
jgi:hypothetical protein